MLCIALVFPRISQWLPNVLLGFQVHAYGYVGTIHKDQSKIKNSFGVHTLLSNFVTKALVKIHCFVNSTRLYITLSQTSKRAFS